MTPLAEAPEKPNHYKPGQDSPENNGTGENARARGRIGGRPKRLSQNKRNLAVRLYNEKNNSIDAIWEMIGITKPPLYKYIRENEAALTAYAIGKI